MRPLQCSTRAVHADFLGRRAREKRGILKQRAALLATHKVVVAAAVSACLATATLAETCDDFVADSDPFDCDAICWQNGTGDRDSIEMPEEGGMILGDTQIVTQDVFSGDLCVRSRVALAPDGTSMNLFVNIDPVTLEGYWGGISRERLIVLGKNPARPAFRETVAPHFPLEGEVDIQLSVDGERVEVRVWPAGETRPVEPQIARVDSEHRTGLVGVGGPMHRVLSVCLRDSVCLPEIFPFLRGDCNDDGTVDISDAVCTLNWLFLGSEAPGCVAALNTNGDEDVDIADPVYLLWFSFLGGPAPVSPYPDCGPGTLPTDEKACETPPKSCQQ